MTPAPTDLELVARAEALLPYSHNPYSGVAVAAVVLTEAGEIFGGVNVENTSLGLTICAERNALGQAVSSGAAGVGAGSGRRITAIAFSSNNPKVRTPCGACCQVIFELAPRARILFGRGGRLEKVWNNVSELLPEAFDESWKTPGP